MKNILKRLGQAWRFLSAHTANSIPLAKILPPRPPVVTIMGHVDHGKTTLLDYLRKSSMAISEVGGITQHIGAFSVDVTGNSLIKKVTFLDTPGHAAFSRMRERGAKATDIVVLVIAADDGLMAQTIESIRYAQAADVPIVAAINKCDKFGDEKVAKIKEDLLKYDVVCEEFGGDTQSVAVSGLTGLGMDLLLESLLLQGELLDLRADPEAMIRGVIVESRVKFGLGECATVLIQQGTLRPGTWIVAEDAICKVRTMNDHAGRMIKEAPPSFPVEIAGWKSLPAVGSSFTQAESEAEANLIAEKYINPKDLHEHRTKEQLIREREVIHDRMWEEKQRAMSRSSTMPLRSVMTYEEYVTSSDKRPVLNLYVKSDVIGSQEAITKVIDTITSTKARISLINNTVGPLTETDIKTAKVTNSKLLLFNLRTRRSQVKMAEKEGVVVKEFNIIYRLADYVTEELVALIPPHYSEAPIGHATVLQIFFLDGSQQVAGCRIDDGNIIRSRELTGSMDKFFAKLIRDENLLWKGRISSMRHLKREIWSASKGLECGIMLEDYKESILPDDRIICIERTIIKPTL